MPSYRFKRPQASAHTTLRLRGITGTVFAVIFAAIGAYLLISAHAATTEQPSVNWKSSNHELINKDANLCLGTASNTKPAAGTKTIIEGCDSINSETWTLSWGSGTVKNTTVVNGYGQCLDDQGASAGVGNAVKIASCAASSKAQLWTTGYGDGTIRIDGLCLGVSGNSTTVNAAVILTPCSTPLPAVSLTSPAANSTLSGNTSVAAAATISQDSIAKITLELGASVLKTCTGTTSCSTEWDTTIVADGSDTLTAVATGSLGGTASISETVKTSNSSSSDGSGGGDSNGGGGTGSGGGSVSSGTDTCSSSDPSCNGGGATSGCDPSDPSCGSVTTCDPSDPTCNAGTTQSTDSGNQQTTAKQSPHRTSKKTTEKLDSSRVTANKILGISALLFALVIIGFLVFVNLKRRKQLRTQPAHDPDAFFDQFVSPAGNPPVATPSANNSSTSRSTPELPAPENPYMHSGTGSDWWKADPAKQPAQPASHDMAADQPVDMFEEGQKRLEEENKAGRIKL